MATVLEPAIDLRIGIAEGDAPYLFGWLADVAALGEGTIVTADSRTGEVRRFDADGRYLGRVGAAGEGPGEYGGTPTDVEALPDDRVVVLAGDTHASTLVNMDFAMLSGAL